MSTNHTQYLVSCDFLYTHGNWVKRLCAAHLQPCCQPTYVLQQSRTVDTASTSPPSCEASPEIGTKKSVFRAGKTQGRAHSIWPRSQLRRLKDRVSQWILRRDHSQPERIKKENSSLYVRKRKEPKRRYLYKMCIERGSNPERKSNIRDIKKRHFLYLTGGGKGAASKPIESPHTIHDRPFLF